MLKCKQKTVFSLALHIELMRLGFAPLYETDNKLKQGFRCWIYELTPEFAAAYDKILTDWGNRKYEG